MHILYLEDNSMDADLTRRELARSAPQHELTHVGTLADAWARLGAGGDDFDLALVDLDLPDGSGIEFVIGVRERELSVALVLLTGTGDERSAVAALKAGADDYLAKGADHLSQLPTVLESARAAFRAGLARRTRPLRVLYAERNAHDIDIVRRHLARHAPHIQIEVVSSGEDVLAHLTGPEATPDVLLLDYRLRGLNALEVVALLQARGLMNMPVVVVTGEGDEAVAVRALRRGVADYLVKRPGYLHELAATLENAHHRALLWREQEALRASEERFRQLADNIDEVFWITSPGRFEVLYVSPSFAKVWGRSCESLSAEPKSWLDVIVPDDRAAVADWLLATQDGAGRAVEYRIQKPDGTVRWIRDRASPVRDAAGVVYRLVGVAEDITERRHLEEQLRQAQKMEAIGQLSGGVAHDFNNLLTIIHGHLGLIEMNGNLNPAVASSIEQISQAASRATNLTRQLLTFSRKQVMQARDLDLREVVADIGNMLKRIVGEDIELSVSCGDEALLVHADAGMLEQILMNLTVNARDAMPRGGRLAITLAPLPPKTPEAAKLCHEHGELAMPEAGYVKLTVADTGVGMTTDVQQRIFEPFFTTKPVGKGTGLGLATVYGIAYQHHGSVKVISAPGAGAIFEVLLPRVVPVARLVKELAVPLCEPDSVVASGTTILVVEDDPSVSRMLNLALGWAGYRVLSAMNGPEALHIWARHEEEIDLLLTDYVMPDGLSGRELAERLLKSRPSLPVLYMSGYSHEIAGREAGKMVPNNFLPKPFGVATLHKAVRDVLACRG